MSRFDPFWNTVCAYRHLMWIGVTFALFYVILGIFAVLLAPRNSPSFAIAVLDLVMALGLLAVLLGMFIHCQRRGETEY